MNIKTVKRMIERQNKIEDIIDSVGMLNEHTLKEYNHLAEMLIQLKAYEAAEYVLCMVLEKFPDDGKALYGMGNISVAYTKAEQAYKYYYGALEKGYVNYRSLFATAMVEKARGNNEKVINLLQRVCNINLENPVPKMLMLAELLEQQECEKAILLSLELQKYYPKDYSIFHSEIAALVALKEYQKAFDRLNEILENFTDNSQFIIDYSTVLMHMKEYQKAWDYLCENNSIVNPNSSVYLRLKSQLASALQLKEESYDAFEALYEIYHYADAALNLAFLLMGDGKVKESASYLSEIINSGKKCMEYYVALFTYAQCQTLLGKDDMEIHQAYQVAIDIYEKAYSEEKNAFFMELAAYCYQALGDNENEAHCRAVVDDYVKEVE